MQIVREFLQPQSFNEGESAIAATTNPSAEISGIVIVIEH